MSAGNRIFIFLRRQVARCFGGFKGTHEQQKCPFWGPGRIPKKKTTSYGCALFDARLPFMRLVQRETKGTEIHVGYRKRIWTHTHTNTYGFLSRPVVNKFTWCPKPFGLVRLDAPSLLFAMLQVFLWYDAPPVCHCCGVVIQSSNYPRRAKVFWLNPAIYLWPLAELQFTVGCQVEYGGNSSGIHLHSAIVPPHQILVFV